VKRLAKFTVAARAAHGVKLTQAMMASLVAGGGAGRLEALRRTELWTAELMILVSSAEGFHIAADFREAEGEAGQRDGRNQQERSYKSKNEIFHGRLAPF
jgi:hypothetical protein